MLRSREQTTLRRPCTITGRGFWSGKLNTLTFLPAPAGAGVQLFRDDLMISRGVQAVAENCQGMSLRTCLEVGQLRFDMIEHVLAALSGLQIDNVYVHCTALEMPSLDGSSYPLVAALQSVGKVRLPAKRPQLRVFEPIYVGNDTQWITVEPAKVFEVEYHLDYGSGAPIPRTSFSSEVTEESFSRDISPARTFVTRAEANLLQGRGLAQHVTERDLIVFGPDGPENNQLRFVDECARHKALDLIGDLAVVGVDLVGKVVAHRSGHMLNAELARKLRSQFLSEINKFEAA